MADTPAQNSAATLQQSIGDTRKQFLALVSDIRPRLHRFCARMSGSVLDGEDLVQETLAQAFFSLSSLKDTSRLEPWLFRIAHNRCVDFLRRAKPQQEELVPFDDDRLTSHSGDDPEDADDAIDDALANLVGVLPPMERACVLLKDVLDYRLTEIADVVDSTLGGVKSALHRGRAKLRETPVTRSPADLDEEQRKLLTEYVDCFNRRDWDTLRRLIQADARVEIVGATEFSIFAPDAPYFHNYSVLPWDWKFTVAQLDGDAVIVHWRKVGPDWKPLTAVRLWWRDGKVARIRDYVHVHYMLGNTRVAGD